MKKIKITETQALKLKEMLNKPNKPKKVKVTQEQYKKILEYELNEGMTDEYIVKNFEDQLKQKPTSKPSPEQITKKLEQLKNAEKERSEKEKKDFKELIEKLKNAEEERLKKEDFDKLIKEVTNQISGKDNIIILISDYVKKHIMEHNKPGVGSIFKKGISEDDIIKMVTNVASKVSGDGGAYELKQSGVGYDLVLPIEKAKALKDAKEGEVEKQEGPTKVKVPSISTTQPASDFSTDRITLIIRKSNPQFLPDDVKNNEDIDKKIKEGKCYSLLTAFPGNPDIPRASEWNGKYAVVIPGSSKDFDKGENPEEITNEVTGTPSAGAINAPFFFSGRNIVKKK